MYMYIVSRYITAVLSTTAVLVVVRPYIYVEYM
jgi:hypothetical protein